MTTMVTDPAELRPLLHRKLDEVPDTDLVRIHEQLLELERQQLFRRMAGDADTDRRDGKLDETKVQQAISQFRMEKPYQ